MKIDKTVAGFVYILVKEYEYAGDGFDIIGVFENMNSLKNYVSVNYPKFIIDVDGDYIYKDTENKFSENTFLIVYKSDFFNNEESQKTLENNFRKNNFAGIIDIKKTLDKEEK